MAVIQTASIETVIRWNLPPYSFGMNFTFTKNSTTNQDVQIPVKFALTGSEHIVYNSLLADSYDAFLIDVDNVLGLGAGTVLGQFANGVHSADGILVQKNRQVASVIGVSGLYLRFSYTSTTTAVGTDVTGFVNFNGFDLTNLGL